MFRKKRASGATKTDEAASKRPAPGQDAELGNKSGNRRDSVSEVKASGSHAAGRERSDPTLSTAPREASSTPSRKRTSGMRTSKDEFDTVTAGMDSHTPERQSHHTALGQTPAADRHFDGGKSEVFRSDEFADEDHFTNRTGNPRIGTHGKKYEP